MFLPSHTHVNQESEDTNIELFLFRFLLFSPYNMLEGFSERAIKKSLLTSNNQQIKSTKKPRSAEGVDKVRPRPPKWKHRDIAM